MFRSDVRPMRLIVAPHIFWTTNYKSKYLITEITNNNMLMADRSIHETDLPAPNETSLEDIFLPVDYRPSREDVICSRGSISYHHGESEDEDEDGAFGDIRFKCNISHCMF